MASPLKSSSLRIGIWASLSVGSLFLTTLLWHFWWVEHIDQQLLAQLPFGVQQQYRAMRSQGFSESTVLVRLGHPLPSILPEYWLPISIGWTMLLIAVLTGGMVGIYARLRFMMPLRSLSEAAQRITKGDYAVRALEPSEGSVSVLIHHFNLMASHLERLEHERKESIAGISHELRTPLTILRGRLHGVYDGVIPATRDEIHKLLQQTEHLVRLVEDVQTVTLAEGNRLSLHRVARDLLDFIEQCCAIFSRRLSEEGIECCIRGQSIRVLVDEDRMRQIMTNLIENVIRYAVQGKVLDIEVERIERDVILYVRDRGPGLPDSLLERVFEPFFRLDHSRSRTTGGTGMGLAVVRSLVLLHGGRIRASNREGGGAEFRIDLPASVA